MKKLLIMLPLVVSLLGCSLSRGGVASYSVVCFPEGTCVSCGDPYFPAYTWMVMGFVNPFWHFGSYWDYYDGFYAIPHIPDFAYISPPGKGREPVKRRVDKRTLQDPKKSRRKGYPVEGLPERGFPGSWPDRDLARSDQGPPSPPPPDRDQRVPSPPATFSPPSPPPPRPRRPHLRPVKAAEAASRAPAAARRSEHRKGRLSRPDLNPEGGGSHPVRIPTLFV